MRKKKGESINGKSKEIDRIFIDTAKAAMLIVISQLAAAWLIELFGLFGMEKTDFTVRKLLGMAVAVVGIVVFQWE